MTLELPVWLQASQFGLSCALGASLGMVYDIFRALRRRHPWLTLPLDFLFGLLTMVSLLLLALYVGQGKFRLFLFPGIFLGAVAYFLTLSRLFLRLWDGLFRGISRMFAFLATPVTFFLRKCKKFCKKIFAFIKKWYTIRRTKKSRTGGKPE